jgi:hypothetical protein
MGKKKFPRNIRRSSGKFHNKAQGAFLIHVAPDLYPFNPRSGGRRRRVQVLFAVAQKNALAEAPFPCPGKNSGKGPDTAMGIRNDQYFHCSILIKKSK